MPATVEPTTDEPEVIGSDNEAAEPDEPNRDDEHLDNPAEQSGAYMILIA
ncbi:hypothetical protein ACIRU3_12930 [Streptomyces sp. NPDC101151]